MKQKGAGAETVVEVWWPNPLLQMAGAEQQEEPSQAHAKSHSCFVLGRVPTHLNWIVVGSDSLVTERETRRGGVTGPKGSSRGPYRGANRRPQN